MILPFQTDNLLQSPTDTEDTSGSAPSIPLNTIRESTSCTLGSSPTYLPRSSQKSKKYIDFIL